MARSLLAAAVLLVAAGAARADDPSARTTDWDALARQGALKREWVPPSRRLNALPAGAVLLALRDVLFPPGQRRVVLHHGMVLVGPDAWTLTEDEPKAGDSFCLIDLKREEVPADGGFVLRAGDEVVLKGETADSPYAPGYTLAVESPVMEEFGCYAVEDTGRAKERATVGLMTEHVRGVFALARR